MQESMQDKIKVKWWRSGRPQQIATVCQETYGSISVSIHPSIYLAIYLLICLSTYQSTSTVAIDLIWVQKLHWIQKLGIQKLDVRFRNWTSDSETTPAYSETTPVCSGTVLLYSETTPAYSETTPAYSEKIRNYFVLFRNYSSVIRNYSVVFRSYIEGIKFTTLLDTGQYIELDFNFNL